MRRVVAALVLLALAACGRGIPKAAAVTTTTHRATTTTVAPVTAEDAAAFARELMSAARATDDAFLIAHLDPAVTDLSGAPACERFVRSANHRSTITVTATEGPFPYEWKVDGITIKVPEVWLVRVDDTTSGKVVKGAVHVGTLTGLPTWFVDCGTPLPEDQRPSSYEVT
jgi:hypothetical protein